MKNIVVAIAEQANTELRILKKEAAKVRRKWLNADTNTVEVKTIRHIAQMLVDKRGLDANETLRAPTPFVVRTTRINLQQPPLAHQHIGVVDDWRETKLVVGRAEHRVALQQHAFQDDALGNHQLFAVANGLQTAAPARGCCAHGYWKISWFNHGVGHRKQTHEPVFAKYRFVTLQPIVVGIRVQQILAVEGIHDPPTIWHRRPKIDGRGVHRYALGIAGWQFILQARRVFCLMPTRPAPGRAIVRRAVHRADVLGIRYRHLRHWHRARTVLRHRLRAAQHVAHQQCQT